MYDLGALEASLKARQDESVGRKDLRSGKVSGFFKTDAQIKFWTCESAVHVVDIIPYRAGHFDPYVKQGEFAYILDIWAHENVGANNDLVVCPAKNYRKPCPICEDCKRMGFDEAKPYIAKRKDCYNVYVWDSDEEKAKGVQQWIVADYFMEHNLRTLCRDVRTGRTIYFALPSSRGKSIQFEKRGKGRGNVEFLGHQFLDRDYDIPDELLQQAICLDEAIEIMEYDEIAKLHYGGSDVNRAVAGNVQEPPSSPADQSQQPQSQQRGATTTIPKGGVCLSGGRFGVDHDKLAVCGPCALWDDCGVAYKGGGTQPADTPPATAAPQSTGVRRRSF